ncbi:LysR family transcriptional regulator [Consotaella salsifontis]|uniref:DNA-binding transcriptional regulator, LysR family n=1 Tax=Consotaella salsifontis TaxID=1365950 RepID=A0A1T4S8Z0_9HYPH|nr:LysR family transcriptional regulator [Consotaella salsifontis]SKA24368.1 DNA-binding transcriptional regulator, LysR family [Consotaella salsifontis]
MDLLALSDFNLVAKHGGFGRAARAARRPKATLSRRVAELEAALGLRLFERGGREIKLTQEGKALYERTAALLTEIDETAAMITSGGDRPKGKLRISVPLLFAQTAMGKLAAQFSLLFPQIRLEISAEDREVDMIEEGYDLIIRVNPAPDTSLVGRAFLRDRLVVVASPDVPRPDEGEAVNALVRGALEPARSWTIATDAGPLVLDAIPVLSLSSMIMLRDAARAGAGVAQLPISLVSRDIATGALVRWGDVEGSDIALWALYPSRRLLSSRVSAFLKFLQQSFPQGAPEDLASFLSS